jgi:hypothetical protein
MLQHQAMTVQQQQLMALAEQQKAAEQELIHVAKQVGKGKEVWLFFVCFLFVCLFCCLFVCLVLNDMLYETVIF